MTEMTVQELREQVKAWLDDNAELIEEFSIDHDESAEQRWVRDARFMEILYDARWNRFGWPEEFGGLGGSLLLRAALYDELEEAGYRVPEQYVQLEIQGNAFMRFAPEIAAQLMPAALRGNEMWSQGFSEPGAGSDLASLRCRAELVGDEYVINGQKIWSSYAVSARWMGVLARTGSTESRHRGITMFLVDLEQPGVEVRGIKYANDTNEFAEVFLDDVRVPVDRVIGEVNGGWAVAMYLLQFERASYGWMRQAHITRRLRQIAAALVDPGDAAAAELGSLWLSNFLLRARSGATVRRLSAGEPIGPEASIDKIMLATVEQGLTNSERDLLPDRFIFDDDGTAATWRDEWFYSRAATIYGGAGEVQRGIIADHLLKLPREAK